MRAYLSAFGGEGHAFPVLALARELRARGHEVWFESVERYREIAEGMGLGFVRALDYIAPIRPVRGMPASPTLAEAVQAEVSVIREIDPDVVVNDFFTMPALLAAELEETHRATLVHHTYPPNEPGLPYTYVGLLPPRTRLGALTWRLSYPWFSRHARRDRGELNEVRAELGLPPLSRLYGGISDELAMVATFPQLEYPRKWPPHVHVTGPMLFEPPGPDVQLPDGPHPLIVVAGSTGQDLKLEVVRTALEALAEEPVNVLVTLSRRARRLDGALPANATVVEWIAYSQVLPRAALLISNGGHGTVARALAEGVPQVIRPAGGDMGENGARVAWAGAGVIVPRGVFGPRSLRWAVRMVLADPRYRERARALAAWSRANNGAASGADLVERLVRG